MSDLRTVTTKIRLEVEITGGDNWGLECSMQQVIDQGSSGAIRLLHRAIEQEKRIKIVGEPKVTVVHVAPK